MAKPTYRELYPGLIYANDGFNGRMLNVVCVVCFDVYVTTQSCDDEIVLVSFSL